MKPDMLALRKLLNEKVTQQVLRMKIKTIQTLLHEENMKSMSAILAFLKMILLVENIRQAPVSRDVAGLRLRRLSKKAMQV